MLVPETPMDKYYRSSRRKYEIGLTRQVLSMKTITVAKTMSCSSDSQLRGRVFGPNRCHDLASSFPREDVHHLK